MGSTVAITRCRGYEFDKVLPKVKEALDLLGGLSQFVGRGDRVLLKPNFLVARPPEKCVTTHPAVVKAVAQLVLDAGGKPIIGDSPNIGTAAQVAKVSGVEKVATELGLDIVEFEPAEFKNPDGKVFKSFVLGKVVKEVDKIISLPKLKTHTLTYMTLAVKNVFGCIPGMRKAQWHLRTARTSEDSRQHFSQMLVDLHQLVRPTISIVDGIIGMEGNGPGSGPPKPLGIVVAGADSFSVDRVIAEVVGTEPDLITTLDVAKGNEYGVIDMAGIEVVGETIDGVRVGDFTFPPSTERPQKMLQVMSFLLRDSVTERPVINKETCRSCEQCAQACPMECITQLEEGFEIDRKRCIQCYCCIEVCPEGAVELKRGRYLRAYEALRKGQRAVKGLFRR